MSYALKLAGAAVVVVFGGLLFFVWRTDKRDKERRAGIDELSSRLS